MSIKDIFKKEKTVQTGFEEKPKVQHNTVAAPAVPDKPVVQQHTVDSKPERATVRGHRVLIKPLNTEKGAKLASQGKYLFMVDRVADKISISRAVEEMYNVKVASVNVIRYEGKQVRYGRVSGNRKDWKKAIVTLTPGQTIEVYKGV